MTLCQDCGDQFNNISEYGMHRKLKHDKRSFICEVCGEFWEGRVKFINHVSKHQTDVCKDCQLPIPQNSKSGHKAKCGGQDSL